MRQHRVGYRLFKPDGPLAVDRLSHDPIMPVAPRAERIAKNGLFLRDGQTHRWLHGDPVIPEVPWATVPEPTGLARAYHVLGQPDLPPGHEYLLADLCHDPALFVRNARLTVPGFEIQVCRPHGHPGWASLGLDPQATLIVEDELPAHPRSRPPSRPSRTRGKKTPDARSRIHRGTVRAGPFAGLGTGLRTAGGQERDV